MKQIYRDTYGFNNINVLFCTDSLDEINEMKKYFYPFWIPFKDNNTYWKTISKRISINDLEYDELINLNYEYEDRVMYDYRAAYKYQDDEKYILSLDFSWFVVFLKKEKITILYRLTDEIHSILISQIIKDPIMAKLKMEGFVVLHCSACEFNNKGIIMPANKRGGKSTLLMYFLEMGAKYIGNDSALCRVRDDKVEIYSYPHMIRFGYEACMNFDATKKFLIDEKNISKVNHPYFMANRSAMVLNKIQLTTKGVLDLFNVYYSEKCDLDSIIYPAIDISLNKPDIKKFSADDTHRIFRESTFNRDQRLQWLPYFNSNTLDLRERESFEKILKYIDRSYLLTYGEYKTASPQNILKRIGENNNEI